MSGFAASGRAPITAVIIIFELTRNIRLILPLKPAHGSRTGAERPARADHVIGWITHRQVLRAYLERHGKSV